MASHLQTLHAKLNKIRIFLNRRPFVALGSVLFTLVLFIWYTSLASTSITRAFPPRVRPYGQFDGKWQYERDRKNLILDQAQCSAAFPGLFAEVDRAVGSRRDNPVTLDELDAIEPKNGYVRAMIHDQQLYIIAVQGNIYSRERATLHAIHRAITSSPIPLPNVEFVFNTDDVIFEKVALWGYARRHNDEHIWLMPDFGYWSWPEAKVGTLREVQLKAIEMETGKGYQWKNKIPKLLWRGATMNLPLRERLLEVTRGKDWADVLALNWHDKQSMTDDLKSMPEHCQYKYLAHTEGNSYSGRLKYLQNCASVVIAHEMDWIQHHHPLMHKSGPMQNYVEIDRNFDHLEEAILNLERNPKEAQHIAANNVKIFRERYLTPAAESCYWRRLIYGWSEVSFQPAFYKTVDGIQVWRGLPVESFLLEGRLDWDPY